VTTIPNGEMHSKTYVAAPHDRCTGSTAGERLLDGSLG